MFTDNELQFFQQKLYDLGTAVFYNQSNAVLKIPNRIISVLHIDEVGQIWFFVKRPTQRINEFEKAFYTNLDFSRKGKDFFMKVEGKAYLVTDPEEINEIPDFPDEVKERARKEELLIKIKTSHITYYEKAKKPKNNWLEVINTWFYNLLYSRRPAYRFYKLQPEPGF
jgi:general stress protein 26